MTISLREVREKIRDRIIEHDRNPMNEQQIRAVLQELLIDLADVEASMPDDRHAGSV